MTPHDAIERILELSYAGHPDGRAMRLEMIERYARAGLAGTEAAQLTTAPVIRSDGRVDGMAAAGFKTYPVARPDGTVVNVTVPEDDR